MKLFVTVDSIEGNLANLLLRGEEEEWPLGIFPLEALPEGVEAGDIISLKFEAEPKETEAARKRISEIRKKLLNKQ
ncbi:MAG TPA: DUF3006 domain-containing protein [Methanocorpusculum sp.]|nr:DUF3006 domain-containing protein [Methanocorpusculum sp.]